MGDPNGFWKWPRQAARRREVDERVGDYREIVMARTPTESKRQAGRCMDCGVPFCHQGCPLGNRIPDFNELIYRDRWRAAYEVLATTNDFPEITGRVCPAPCEKSCVLGINDDPVTIEQQEKEIIERAFAQGWVTPKPPTTRSGHRVAIVGSGPAGLAAAYRLNQAGHLVTVFEAADRVGGLLRYGIPDFKLERGVLDRRLDVMRAEGVVFETGVRAGVDRTWASLREEFDAVVVAIGAQQARDLDVPGRELEGIHLAMDFLEQQNRVVAGDKLASPQISAMGKRVAVIGGGDTGADCHGTSIRQGAASVTSLEIVPMPPSVRPAGNPWPQWPLVLRTSSSHEEGGGREFAVSTVGFEGDDDGKVRALRLVRVARVVERGRMRLERIVGSEFLLPAELVLLAIGFTGPRSDSVAAQLGADVDARGQLVIGEDRQTSVPGVFAAGDAVRGPSLVVWALADGRETAHHVDRFLRGEQAVAPTRGRDRHFGGR